jgi:DNA-binding MarR family transcriptional regulator
MSEFRADVLMLLHDVARLHRVAADKRARMHDMTRAQWVMLLRLERKPGLSQKELSELLEVEPITVARLIDRLEQRGLVERRPDPKDRRIWRLHLRPEAMPLVREISQERNDIAAMSTEGLDEQTLSLMKTALTRMRETLCGEVRCNRRPASRDGQIDLVADDLAESCNDAAAETREVA